MSNEEYPADTHSAIVERFIEQLWNQGDLAAAEDLVAPDVFYHEPMTTIRGLDEYKEYVRSFRAAFPDTRFTMDDLVVEGNKVALRWTFEGSHRQVYPKVPVPPTRRRLQTTGITVYHIEDGKIKELWLETDYSPILRAAFSAVAVLAGIAVALMVTVGVAHRFLGKGSR